MPSKPPKITLASIVKILVDVCGPLGLGATLLGFIRPLIGWAVTIGGFGYLIFQFSQHIKYFVRRKPVWSLILCMVCGAAGGAGLWYTFLKSKAEPPQETHNEQNKPLTKADLEEIIRRNQTAENHGVGDNEEVKVGKTPSTQKTAKPTAHPVSHAPLNLPRLGLGPDAYKDIDDAQFAQWADQEADKMEAMADDCLKNIKQAIQEKLSQRAPQWFFTNEFKSCCLQDVIDLRTEALRRLGPPGKEPREQQYFEMMTRVDYEGMLSYATIRMYAQYLRDLGQRVKRRSIPRSDSRIIPFYEFTVQSDKPEFPIKMVVVITPKTTLESGFIAVELSKPIAIIGTDWQSGANLRDTQFIRNNKLLDYLATNSAEKLIYSFEIGKTPMAAGSTFHVTAYGRSQIHVTRVTWFDE